MKTETEGLSREWEELAGRVVVTLHMTVHAPLTGKHFDECDKPCCKQLRELRQAASSLKQAPTNSAEGFKKWAKRREFDISPNETVFADELPFADIATQSHFDAYEAGWQARGNETAEPPSSLKQAPTISAGVSPDGGNNQRSPDSEYDRPQERGIAAETFSLKEAPQEYEIMDTSSMKREPAEGKQAEPPSLCAKCGMYSHAYEHDSSIPAWRNANYHTFVPVRPESPSQASTQPPSETDWDKVHALLEPWQEVWSGDRAKFSDQYPKWMLDASAELFAHDMCDAWAWNEYVLAAATIIARHAPDNPSQATKEEWARRIAEDAENSYPLGNFYERVLALMTNERKI